MHSTENLVVLLTHIRTRLSMKSFDRLAAQGDVLIERIDELPKNLVEVPPVGNFHVIAHSETNHDHVIPKDKATVYRSKTRMTNDPVLQDLFFEVKETTSLDHQRSFDTHESLELKPGFYRARRQREHSPQGQRMVSD